MNLNANWSSNKQIKVKKLIKYRDNGKLENKI
jgi:hypothetical protein